MNKKTKLIIYRFSLIISIPVLFILILIYTPKAILDIFAFAFLSLVVLVLICFIAFMMYWGIKSDVEAKLMSPLDKLYYKQEFTFIDDDINRRIKYFVIQRNFNSELYLDNKELIDKTLKNLGE